MFFLISISGYQCKTIRALGMRCNHCEIAPNQILCCAITLEKRHFTLITRDSPHSWWVPGRAEKTMWSINSQRIKNTWNVSHVFLILYIIYNCETSHTALSILEINTSGSDKQHMGIVRVYLALCKVRVTPFPKGWIAPVDKREGRMETCCIHLDPGHSKPVSMRLVINMAGHHGHGQLMQWTL